MDDSEEMDPGFLGIEIRFRIRADFLEAGPKKPELNQMDWCQYQDDLLKTACAAINTPSLLQEDKECRQEWWQLVTDLDNAKTNIDYIQEFSDRMDDALNQLTPRRSFSDVYQILQSNSTIRLQVASSDEHIATKNYKTKLSANKGLIDFGSTGMGGICYYLYRMESRETALMPRPSQLQKPLSIGDQIFLFEDARLQFKRLYYGMTLNPKRTMGRRTFFRPANGQDYVNCMWDSYYQGLGEYISAFTKNQRGGVIYYGMKETSDHSGYVVEGLSLDENEKDEIKRGICTNVRDRMLWIEKDPYNDSGYGYKEITPQHCEEGDSSTTHAGHFTVNFIKVSEKREDPQGSQSATADVLTSGMMGPDGSKAPKGGNIPRGGEVNRTRRELPRRTAESPSAATTPLNKCTYILEVRVAPFNGVVFYDPEGPEAYRMEDAGEKFQPRRVSKDEWLTEMRRYGWCCKHRSPKEKECEKCISERNMAGAN